MKQIHRKETIAEAQLNAGDESTRGFRDTFAKLLDAPPTRAHLPLNLLNAACLETPLGSMLAIANDHALYLLEFIDKDDLGGKVERLRNRTNSTIVPGTTKPIQFIENELKAYFEGALQAFKTPLFLLGSPFQKQVWGALKKIPPGETRPYCAIAKAIGRPTAFRAVARANGANQLAVIIPCHRVIHANGSLGGYSGGAARKQWLLDLEKITAPKNRNLCPREVYRS